MGFEAQRAVFSLEKKGGRVQCRVFPNTSFELIEMITSLGKFQNFQGWYIVYSIFWNRSHYISCLSPHFFLQLVCRVLAFDPPRHTCTTNIIIIIAANQAMSVLLSVLNNIATFIATACTRAGKTAIAGLQGFYNVVCRIQTASFRGITRFADQVFSIFTDVTLPGVAS